MGPGSEGEHHENGALLLCVYVRKLVNELFPVTTWCCSACESTGGTTHYMAPEVMRGKGYGLEVDVPPRVVKPPRLTSLCFRSATVQSGLGTGNCPLRACPANLADSTGLESYLDAPLVAGSCVVIFPSERTLTIRERFINHCARRSLAMISRCLSGLQSRSSRKSGTSSAS